MAFKSYRYVLEERVGHGGMGEVYTALDRLTGERVALKQIRMPSLQAGIMLVPPQQALQSLRLALAHEFRTLATLRHPNIISVLDYGFDQRNRPYFTMRYLEDAQTILQAGSGQTTTRQVQLIQELLESLAYLHRRSILHRDIKPENVLVTDDTVRVLDFGLATAKDDALESVGTWQYSAPEIFQEQSATEASDLYSVGLLAYELIAGERPFDMFDPDFLDLVLYEPADVTRLNVDAALANVVATLLEKEPQNRYPNAEAAIVAFSEAMSRPMPRESASIRESYLQAAQFVGRDEELSSLRMALAQAKNGTGSAWLVGGESGVGKTRLLNELQIEALVDGFLVLRGQGIEGGGRPYQLWIDALRHLILQKELDDLSAGVLQAIVPDMEQLLNRPIPAPPTLNENAARQRLFSTIAKLFRQTEHPILLILEDLQWTKESLDILMHVNWQLAQFPLLIIGTYRDDERPNLPQELSTMTLMTLSRLNQQEIATLSSSMLGEAGQQAAVLELLQRETEGNAFFLVEVVRALAEEAGRLSAISQASLPERLFPQGIETIVSRRLAQVSETARSLLPGAAVLGRQLDLSLLMHLAQRQPIYIQLDGWLSTCADAAIFDVANGRWQFAHDKLREGILNRLTAVERADWHLQAAQAIEAVYPAAPEQASTLVYHWRTVGDVTKERHYARVAGEFAHRQFLNQDAINYFSRSLALTPDAELEERYQLLEAREEIYHLQGEREVQLQDIEALQLLAEQIMATAGEDRRVDVSLRQARYAEATADYPTAIAATTTALELATDAAQEAASHLALGRSLMRQGNYEEAREQFERSLNVAQHNALSQIEADSFRFLGSSAADLGQFDPAITYYQKALPIYQDINDKQGESVILNNLGVAAYSQGDLVACLTFWGRADNILEQIGDREGRGRLLTNLSSIYIDLGDYETAQEYSETALQICREINTRFGECFNLINLGLVAHYRHDFGQADSFSQEALDVAEAIGSTFLQGLALKDRAYILTHEERVAEAKPLYQRALTIWTELEQQSQLTETMVGLAQATLLLGEPERAYKLITPVVTQSQSTTLVNGMSRPFHVYLTCYEVMKAFGDEQASVILQVAVRQLEKQASNITDEQRRHRFLNEVAIHQQILAAAQ